MLKEKDLTPERTDAFVKVAKGEKLTLLEIRGRIKEAAEDFGIAHPSRKSLIDAASQSTLDLQSHSRKRCISYGLRWCAAKSSPQRCFHIRKREHGLKPSGP